MSLDTEVVTYLQADDTLMAIVTGGIYAKSVIGGADGFSRDDDSPTADAFDADGFLLPSIMVKEAAKVPFGDVQDLVEKKAGVSQRVELYFFEDRGHDAIDLAKERTYLLIQGHAFSGSYKARWILDTPPVPDSGPLKGNTTIRQDFQIVSVRG